MARTLPWRPLAVAVDDALSVVVAFRAVLPGVWLFAVLTCASATAAAGAQSSVAESVVDVARLRLSFEPSRIVAGETPEAFVDIEATTKDRQPLDGALPRLMTSTGTFGDVVRTAPGRYRARWLPPKEAFPHVALVSATIGLGDDVVAGFVALPLWGRGQTTVKTKPQAQVTVRVGADSFGPVVADGAGDAVVPLLVPPGPEHAVAESVDASGNASQKAITLGVPAFNRLTLRALDDVAVVGDARGARLLVFVVDKKGAPLVDARVVASTPRGPLPKPRALAPGVLAFRVFPDAGVGDVVVTAKLADAPLSTADARVRVVAAAPARVTLQTPSRSLNADDDRRVLVEAAIFDAAEEPLPLGAVHLEVDEGRLDAIASSTTGGVITWLLPARIARPTATLRARGIDGQLLGTLPLALLPGRPATLAIAPLADIVADGRSSARIVVTAADAAGNPVVPRDVEFNATRGHFAARSVDAAAHAHRALFVPDPSDDAHVVQIEARSGTLTATAPLRVLPRPHAALLAGAAVSSSWAFGDVSAVGGEVTALVRLPVLDGSWHVGVDAGLLVGVPAASSRRFQQHRAVPLLVEAAWRPVFLDDVVAHVAVDAGVVVVDATVDGGRTVQPSPAIAAQLGIARRAGPGFLEVDARLGWAFRASAESFPGASFGPGLVVAYRFGL